MLIAPLNGRRGPYLPAGIPALNEAHPLRAYLQSAIVAVGNKLYDLTGYNGPSTAGSGTPTTEFGYGGAYAGYNACSNDMPRGANGSMSVVMLVVRTVTPNGSVEGNKIGTLFATKASGTAGVSIVAGNTYGNANKFYLDNFDACWIDGAKQSGTNPADVTISNGTWYSIGATAASPPTGSVVRFGRMFEPAAGTSYWLLGGGISLCLIFNRVLPDAWMARITADPGQVLSFPEDEIFNHLAAQMSVTRSLTGIAITSSAGTVSPTLSSATSGSAATSAAGTVTSALTGAVSGSAATGATGTLAPAIATSVSGSAMTMSAGSLAYTIGFTLTGAASTAAAGTVGIPGNVSRSLTGITITALPGNVTVTGGTRWRPQQAQAVVPPSMVGNTLPPPPRLVGNPTIDTQAQQQWLQTLYDKLVKEGNVLGRVPDHEARIARLENPDADET